VASHTETQRLNRTTGVVRSLHIYSAMPVLLLMIFFAITGLFLNNPAWESTQSKKQTLQLEGPSWLENINDWDENYLQHGLKMLQWLDVNHSVSGTKFEIEWDDYDRLLILTLDSPAGNTVVEVFVTEQKIQVEQREYSLLSMLNNVHRVKHTTGYWSYMSDLSAIAMLIFCLSGFWLAAVNHMQKKPSMYLFTGGSLVFIFVIYLMH
jgi:hypothetical protein